MSFFISYTIQALATRSDEEHVELDVALRRGPECGRHGQPGLVRAVDRLRSRVDNTYGCRARIVCKPWASKQDVIAEHEERSGRQVGLN